MSCSHIWSSFHKPSVSHQTMRQVKTEALKNKITMIASCDKQRWCTLKDFLLIICSCAPQKKESLPGFKVCVCVCVLPEQLLLPLSCLSLTEIQIKQYLKSVCKQIFFLESVMKFCEHTYNYSLLDKWIHLKHTRNIMNLYKDTLTH